MAHAAPPGRLRLVLTGSSGFIASHLTERLEGRWSVTGVDRRPMPSPAPFACRLADLSDQTAITRAGLREPAHAVLHLAAEAAAVIPWSQQRTLWDSNLVTLLNTLDACDPRTLVFASSCAVYGHVESGGALPTAAPRPVGIYGMSKYAGEMMCRDWAHERRRAAVAFRFGNVIGPRCRGLIPHLVEHACRYPEGTPPVRLRGAGQVLRDYVPVGHVADVLVAAASRDWPAGELQVFNIGAGRSLTNGGVAEVVRDVLARQGLKLSLRFDAPLEHGESRRVVLDVAATEATFAMARPGEEAVFDAIEQATLDHLRIRVAAGAPPLPGV